MTPASKGMLDGLTIVVTVAAATGFGRLRDQPAPLAGTDSLHATPAFSAARAMVIGLAMAPHLSATMNSVYWCGVNKRESKAVRPDRIG